MRPLAPNPSQSHRAKRTLRVELLDRRQLLAAGPVDLPGGAFAPHKFDPNYSEAATELYDGMVNMPEIKTPYGEATLRNGQLTIYGTQESDSVEVRRSFLAKGDPLVVTLNATTMKFNYRKVDQIVFWGYRGNDTFFNYTSIPSILYGGPGRDTLHGGSAGDVIHGNGDDDWLYGGLGDDVLYGDADNDWLFGEDHSDTLWGGMGNDHLYGMDGDDWLYGEDGVDELNGGFHNDRLYGGDGSDTLWGAAGDDTLMGQGGLDRLHGGAANDALFGGIDGLGDLMWGDAGHDRFLVEEGIAERLVDQTHVDVQIGFGDGPGGVMTFSGHTATYDFGAGRWLDDEVEVVDLAFAQLVARTGNNRLLETAAGDELRFERWGDQLAGPGNIGGWSDPVDGTIALTQNRFDEGDSEVIRTVFHEIGHKWDDENPDWEGFMALSGWAPGSEMPDGVEDDDWFVDATGTLWVHAEDEVVDWWYLGTATFARPYGHWNPEEDFACSFAAYFMDQAGLAYPGGGAADIPEKVAFLDGFLDTMSS